MQWIEAIKRVLSEANQALHYTEILEQIVSKGYRKRVGSNPVDSVAATLSTSLREANTPFLRVGIGVYMLKEMSWQQSRGQAEIAEEADQADAVGALRAFGMFWQRDLVAWDKSSKLLGRQGIGGADVIDLAGQVGVYLLHDRERVVYVGQTTDSLFGRLKLHTTGRMAARWDRFSWFGLRSVSAKGVLSDSEVSWTQKVMIETMEAILMESLEPPLNRRAGDNLMGKEYVQVSDPAFETKRQRQLVEDLLARVKTEAQ